ncbi:hypothetical protein ACFL3S_02520 [Gemmatimonadota bacterium]
MKTARIQNQNRELALERARLHARFQAKHSDAGNMLDRADRRGRGFTRREQNRFDLIMAEAENLARQRDQIARRIDGLARRQEARANLCKAIERNPELARRLAIHEASHAVASYLEGTGVGRMALLADAGGLSGGSCLRRRGEGSRITYAAGLAGEALEYGEPPDWDGSGRGDLKGLVDAYEGRESWARSWAWRDLESAQELLRPAWKAVRVLADTLAAEGEISGSRAEEIIRENLPNKLQRDARFRADQLQQHERARAAARLQGRERALR